MKPLLTIPLLLMCLSGCYDKVDVDSFSLEEVEFYENEELAYKITQSINKGSIRYGHFFGNCVGYCDTEFLMTLEGTLAILTSYPDSIKPHKIGKAWVDDRKVYKKLIGLIEMNKIQKMQDVYGCPDCGDGGGEWIEINDGTQIKKIVFNYGDSIPLNNELLTELRSMNENLNKKIEELRTER